LIMEKTSWVIAAVVLAVAGCNAGPGVDAGVPAAAAGEAGSTPETVAQSQAAQAKPAAAVPDDFKPFVDADGRITQGRCHMDACSWMKWEQLRAGNGVRDHSAGEIIAWSKTSRKHDGVAVPGRPASIGQAAAGKRVGVDSPAAGPN
jgi:hypothetical protein